MSQRPVSPSGKTVDLQRQASDPAASSWVAANAGSGKTFVLTARVLRILLSGVAPEEILCLTFTKAAAAEMRARIARDLGDWAVMDTEKLRATLERLTGKPPTSGELGRARTLFAHALETPGGLKINTIHAFCEALLHRFPLEAGVPFSFAVVEDNARIGLVAEAHRAIFADGLAGDHAVTDALDVLFAQLSDTQIEKSIAEALGQMRKLRPIISDPQAAKANLRAFIGFHAQHRSADLWAEIAAGSRLASVDITTLVTAFGGDPQKTRGVRFIDLLARIDDPDHPEAAELVAAFVTGNGTPRSLLSKPQKAEYPQIQHRLETESERVLELYTAYTKTALVERSEALIDLLVALGADYEHRKRARSVLDFDDLIARTIALLSRSESADWVRYKLDAGITHVLVDESQDSNDEQWRVFDSLVTEFFAGSGAVERPRSLFAVGDPKQSIFSFQGAEPRLFATTGKVYRTRAEAAGERFNDLVLHESFRSLDNLLDAVDKTFANPVLQAAALAEAGWQAHSSARTDKGGRLALWDLEREESADLDGDAWPVAATSERLKPAARRLAESIARFIAESVKSGRPLAARGRPVAADDFLILVQSRGAVFHEIIRALKLAGLDTPGADRLDVAGHIAVLDCLALADVLLLPADDLALAALLRSPLFDVSEDDLFEIAYARSGTLWRALGDSTLASVRDAYARLQAWRERLDFGRPYEFYADVLYAGGGLQRFHARLGAEVDDVLAEFLDLALAHEQGPQPSLQGFVVDMRARAVDIKRDLGDEGTGVRIMTVHGAKGLEAPIVILADAATKPSASKTTKPVTFGPPDAPFLVQAGSQSDHCPETLPLRQTDMDAQHEEYWRKLYVAMTRAEDELHVAGILTAKGKVENSWYDAVATALAAELGEDILPGDVPVQAFPAISPPQKPLAAQLPRVQKAPSPPDLAPLPEPVHRAVLRPSDAEVLTPPDPLMCAREALPEAESARRMGIAVHALLEHLPNVPADKRVTAANAALGLLLPDDPERQESAAAQALAILADPDLAFLFGADSRGEIAIAANASEDGKPVRITGRIDRLVVLNDKVLIVDFKSDAVTPEVIPPAYLAQLALYALAVEQLFPGRLVEAAIVWTTSQRLSYADTAMLTNLKARFTIP